MVVTNREDSLDKVDRAGGAKGRNDDDDDDPGKQPFRICPNCNRPILSDAQDCPHCGYDLSGDKHDEDLPRKQE
eukprot:8816170-Karenia_brevis.AAC.1